jgi:hypothetical protein
MQYHVVNYDTLTLFPVCAIRWSCGHQHRTVGSALKCLADQQRLDESGAESEQGHFGRIAEIGSNRPVAPEDIAAAQSG